MSVKSLKLSWWNYLVIACKAKFGGGWASVAEYCLDLLNDKVLSRLAPEELKKYAVLAQEIAELIRKGVEIFVKSEAGKKAGTATIDAFTHLAKALEDGKITAEELDAEIEAVKAAIEAWKAV